MDIDREIQGLLGKSAPCDCGRAHTVGTKAVDIGPGALGRLGETARAVGLKGKALVVSDPNTQKAAGVRAEEELRASGFAVESFVFPAGELHTDERAVGSVLMALPADASFILAVGSGTINDTCRFVAKRTGLPYVVAGTAPSMDGYTSAVSPAVRGGFKATFQGVAPLAVAGDTEVLRNAPMKMLAAGFGDVFGKITARLDWLMAERLTGEYRCEAIAGVVRRAVDACMDAAPGLADRDAAAVEGLMRALTLSGIAMQMADDSRPASGAEHQIAHFLEMRDMARGRAATLHGDKVGLAELIVMRFYERFFESASPAFGGAKGGADRDAAMRRDLGSFAETVIAQNRSKIYRNAELAQRILHGAAAGWARYGEEAAALPALRAHGEGLLRSIGGPVRPSDLGYGREDIVLALKYATELREKFNVLRLAQLAGRLDALAEELADEFC